MEDMQVEGLRIQVQNDYSLATNPPENLVSGVENTIEDTEVLTSDVTFDNQEEIGIPQITIPGRAIEEEEEGEISSTAQEEGMELDNYQFGIEGATSPHRSDGSQPSSSDADDQDKDSYTNQNSEGRKTRRYLNPFLKKNPQKMSSRANRFGNDESFSNVEYNPEKLGSRAERFGIKKEEITTFVEPQTFDMPSDEKRLDLYFSVGLIPETGGKLSLEQVDPKSRLDSILIRGTNNMSTNEIFKYLHDNNVHPVEMEWVNDACCVVIYKDFYDAAGSLLNITKPILIEPPRKSNKDDDQGAAEEDGELSEEDDDINYHDTDVVSSRLIKVPMPPGYVWRFAVPCEKATGILMRYANVNDKKQEKSERHSVYYRKHGNPNYGGVPAFFTSAAKARKSSDPSIGVETIVPKIPIENKYAWSDLSAAWGEQEREEELSKKGIKISPEILKATRGRVMRDNSAIKSLKIQVNFDKPSNSIHSRLKRKRDHSSGDEDEVPTPVSNRRHHTRRSNRTESDEDSADGMEWTKKLRGPVMRMHADEEEQRMKRRTKLRKVSSPSFLPTSSAKHYRAARTTEIDRDRQPRKGSIKDRLGGFRDHEGAFSGNQDSIDFQIYHPAISRTHTSRRSLADRLGKRYPSPVDEDDIFV